MALALAPVMLAITGPLRAQAIGPGQQQELIDANNAVETARKTQAEKYAAMPFKQAQDSLQSIEAARAAGDAKKFSEIARIARAYAELAVASSELAIETEKAAAINAAIEKAKAEIERLGKPK